MLYVLDEPSIGLHQRDNDRLLATLKGLRDLGNTVLVVEHDADTIRAADYILDLGPGAGVHGGELVAAGTLPEILAAKKSLTGQYLTGELEIPVPEKENFADGGKGLAGNSRLRRKTICRTLTCGFRSARSLASPA